MPPHSMTPTGGFVSGSSAWFTGIGGCGMSALARLAAAQGVHVRGSDAVPSAVTDALQHEGIEVHIGDASIPQDTDLHVYSAAIESDHPERRQADAMGTTSVSYAQGLGMAQVGRLGVSIAGTHGKSTTSAMLAWILKDTNLDPGYIIGANCPNWAADPILVPRPFRRGRMPGKAAS